MLLLRLVATGCLVASACRSLPASELTARDLATPSTAVLVEVNRPIQVVESQLTRDLYGLISRTTGVQKKAGTPEFEKIHQLGRFIEKSLGVDWQTGVSKLTAGGIVVAITPRDGPGEPEVTVVVTALDESTLKQFMEAVHSEVRRTSSEGKEPETASYKSYRLQRVGNGYLSVAGRQLVVSNARPVLESALDRLTGALPNPPLELPPSLRLVDGHGDAPAILATVNLRIVRRDPKLQDVLKFPADDIARTFLLGGYLDLLRRADYLAAAMFVDPSAYEFRLRIAAGTDGSGAGLPGFFATTGTESALPLLKPVGTLFSGSWFRDYQRLWDARGNLLNAEQVGQLDAADERARSQPAGVGISDLGRWLGPHFRVVAARQREQVYPRQIEERLPAVGLVVGIRDEAAVRDRLLAPLEGLLQFALNEKMEDFKKVEHRGAQLTTFRFSEKAMGSGADGGLLLHFNPAWSLARGQLILGSSAELVRDLIDELHQEGSSAAETGLAGTRVTDRQHLALAEIGVFLRQFQGHFVREAMRKESASADDATKDLELLGGMLNRIGSAAARHEVAEDHFDISLTIGRGK